MNIWDKKLAIILPTYNESQNIRLLLNAIYKVVPNASIYVVDDSSSLENVTIRKIAASYKNVAVITRQKKLGRGNAVLVGFEQALNKREIEYFVEMDTNLAHDPLELPLLKKALEGEDAQLVIGSRYLSGSKIVDWPIRRLVLSKLINFFLNLWLGIKLHDYTDGYRMYQRKAVEYLVKTGLNERNFIALSESAFLLHKKGFHITEVPITFTDRRHGKSTVGSRELFISLVGALRIWLRFEFLHVKKNDLLPALLLFLLACLFFYKIFLHYNEMIFPAYDLVGVYSFWRIFFVNSFLHFGQIPLWNPYQFSGTPFVANPSSGMFYPFNLLFFLFPTDLVFGYLFIVDIFLIGLFTYLFARTIKLSNWSSLISAVTMMFSGVITVRIIAGHIIILDTILWFPLLLLLYEKAIQQRSLRFGVLAGLPIGLMLIAGHTQFAIFGLLAALIYYLLRMISGKKISKFLLPFPFFFVFLAIMFGDEITYYIFQIFHHLTIASQLF